MKLIEKLCGLIDEELGDAEKYAKLALKHKDENAALAKTFYDLSTDELRHMDLLHDQIVQCINDVKREKGEPPATMTAIYGYLHEKQIDRASAVRAWLSKYRK